MPNVDLQPSGPSKRAQNIDQSKGPLDYWQHQLQDTPALLPLPADFPRPATQSFSSKCLNSRIAPAQVLKLESLSQQHDCSLFITLLSAFNVLLHRYSGQSDLLIGCPGANILVLRTNIDPKCNFLQLLQQVLQTCIAADTHQDVPFEQLLKTLNPQCGLNHHPLFQVVFALQNDKISNQQNQYDLALNVSQTDGQLNLAWTYATDLFKAERIERMSQHFATLLNAIVKDPTDNIQTLPLLTEAETEQLRQWNQPTVSAAAKHTITGLFEQQASITPNKTAVVFEGKTLSYRQLNQQANQLAHYLKNNHNVTAGTLVAICVERSLQMIIGLLGILKAGGAYVPLDPDSPAQRLRHMIDDSQVELILSHQQLKSPLPPTQAQIVYLDERQTFADQPVDNPAPASTAADLAYVIYTSGSTGLPKGCLMTHHNFARLLESTQSNFGFDDSDVWTMFHSYAFDISVWEIWGALCTGAELVIVPYMTSRDPEVFLTLLQRHQVTVLNQTPSAFALLIKADKLNADKYALRWVIFGGETLVFSSLQPWFDVFGDQQPTLVNMYGITETTVHTTFFALTEQMCQQPASIIGRPIGDLRAAVVDTNEQPVPVGISGELLIGGPGLSQGYLNRPELTAQKFVDIELFAEQQRLYKSGDLVRWLPDGNLEYLGRMDNQVKLRGFRIELGEIESVVRGHQSVKAIVVKLHQQAQMKSLAAYLTVDDTQSLDVDELRSWLKTRLPDYMMPASFTVLEQMPLTVNGKVDHGALPEPKISQDTAAVTLKNASQILLAKLWSDVLNIDVNSATAHFFDLGGHSLLATQLVSRIRDSFGIEMPLPTLFDYPRLNDLAQWINQQQGGNTLSPIEAQDPDQPLILSHAQQRLWFLAQLSGPSATYNLPTAFELKGMLNIPALENTLLMLVAQQQSLRLIFPEVDGQASVRELPPYNPLTVSDLRDLPADEHPTVIQQRVYQHANQPFDLAEGPLLHIELLNFDDKHNVLLLNMHHIISDGWSMGVLMTQWSNIYNALNQGQQPKLTPLPIQYSDHAAWQHNWLQGEVLQNQLNYWTIQLQGLPDLLPLPTDFPRPAAQSYRGAQLTSKIGPQQLQPLKKLSRQHDCTLFMTLLSAFNVLLYRYSGQTDIPIGSPIANRSQSQLENLIGFFANTLVLRTAIEPNTGFAALLKHTRQTTLDAYAHQDTPFEYLVEQLNPQRSTSHNPLFQVSFVGQIEQGSELELAQLAIEPLPQTLATTKFDLTLNAFFKGNHVELLWEYATDLFEPKRIERMSQHFATLLDAIIKDPTGDIQTSPLLTEAETEQLRQWNQPTVRAAVKHTITGLFEQQTGMAPDKTAVVFEGKTLSYRQLNQQANQLAHYLKNNHNVAAGTLVAICVERSLEMIIGLLGILKAGGAYVPLDPDSPAQRLRHMIDDSQVELILSHQQLKSPLPPTQAQIVYLDERQTFADQPVDNPAPASTAADLAYVIYTSGSTGLPKGCLITHHNFVRLLESTRTHFGFDDSDVWTMFHSCAFDFSVWEIWGALCCGGKLVVVPYLTSRDPDAFITLLQRQQVTVLNQTPSAFAQLIEADQRHSAGYALKWVIFGGETLALSSLQPWFDKFGSQPPKLVNMYGITETTVHVTCCPLTEQICQQPASIIGRPIGDLRVAIVDACGQPVPVGIGGELLIGGPGLSPGYLNRPELSAEKFVEIDLFGEQQRLYKSGDLARWLPDGNLEYLGRIDKQVKLRGFRIELGEIESAVGDYPSVKAVVVKLHQQAQAASLAAYLTIDDTQPLDVDALRRWLKTRLPDYMVPASFTVLEQMPLTHNGKINHGALPAPKISQDVTAVKLQGETQILLARLWSDLLNIDINSATAHFFDLGGHSLLATRLVSRIRDHFGLQVPLPVLFDYPQLEGLAQYIQLTQLQQSIAQNNPVHDEEEFEL